MDRVHWFALTGMVAWFGAVWAFARAAELLRQADVRLAEVEHFAMVRRVQLAKVTEAIELARYGARQEAEDLIAEAVEIGEEAWQ